MKRRNRETMATVSILLAAVGTLSLACCGAAQTEKPQKVYMITDPVIMLSGDTAACKELHDLVPEAECAEVKSGVSRTAGFMLSHSAACVLIREKAQRAMQRLAEFRPYKITDPVEVKVEFTTASGMRFGLREGVERVNERTWVFRGKDIIDAWLKYGSF